MPEASAGARAQVPGADREGDLVERIRDDPFGRHLTGVFLPRHPPPARVPSRDEFERIADRGHVVTMRVRHLPTRLVLERVAEERGDAAWPLLRTWRGLWEDLVGDVDAFAASVGYGPGWSAPRGPWTPPVAGLLDACRTGTGGPEDAHDAFALAVARAAPRGRPRTDAQHALEDAAVATALHAAGRPFGLDVAFGDEPAAVSVRPGEGATVARGRGRVVARLTADLDAVNPYWLLQSFASACPRRMTEVSGGKHLVLALLDLARQGGDRAFLKSAAFKGGTWLVDLAGADDVPSVTTALMRATGPSFLDLASVPSVMTGPERQVERALRAHATLVQECVDVRFEYRFFVVDWRVVAGTASDRRATVLDAHRAGRLDPRVAALRRPPRDAPEGPYDRGDTRAVPARALVARMARAARKLLRAMRRDHVAATYLDRAFTLDLGGLGADPATAAVEPIEVNTFRNSGLYAVDYGRVARALARPARGR